MYDVYPVFYYQIPSERQQYFSSDNLDEASELFNDLLDQCGSTPVLNMPDWSQECWQDGNRWSVIYSLCGVTILLLAANSALMFFGAWSFHARGLAACCGSLCCCLNLAAIILTGIFRYRTFGQFTALCDGGSKYVDSLDTLSDERTYAGDALLITILWVCQMVFCLTSCCHLTYSGKPSQAVDEPQLTRI